MVFTLRDMRWIAQLADGRIMYERERNGNKWKETSFKAIPLAQVVSFGIEGSGLRLGFQTSDGIIGLDDTPLRLKLVTRGGDTFLITGRADLGYQEIIQYKEAAMGIRMGSGSGGGGEQILSYNIGYKLSGSSETLGVWEAKVVATVPTGDQEMIYAHLWLTCSAGFTGHLDIGYGSRNQRVGCSFAPGSAHRIRINMPSYVRGS